MTWFVHRRDGGALASIHRDEQPGYAEEEIPDDAPEIVAFLTPPPDPLAAGYHDAATGLVLPLDPASQGQITAQGAAAVGAIATDPNGADALTYLFPTLDGAGVMVTGAAAAFGLADRCRAYVEAVRKAALGL